MLRLAGVLAVSSSVPLAAADPFAALGLIRLSGPTLAQDFRTPAPGGGTVMLSDHHGKVIVLNFWATWCPSCREEMPAMEHVYRRFRDRGLVVLAVSVDADGETAVPAFLKERDLTFPVALDPGMRIAGQYGVRALPATFLIDRKGRIIARAFGAREWDSPDAIAVLEQLLASP
ncbi:MAG: TlpA disulfide reductase family protein [Candidatus Rokuibacteriota bacterium]